MRFSKGDDRLRGDHNGDAAEVALQRENGRGAAQI
jgi:hypothetical protein